MRIPRTLLGDVTAGRRFVADLLLPPGARQASGSSAWLRTVGVQPDVLALRADGRLHVEVIAAALARHADWRAMTTRPTWAVLMDRTGLSRATVARWLAWLQVAGLLSLVEGGTTPQFRPRPIRGTDENRAAVYLLITPIEDAAELSSPRPELSTRISETPTHTPSYVSNPNAGARESREESRGPLARSGRIAPNSWKRTAAAATRAERLELVRRLQAEAHDLRRLSDRALRHLLRPWLLAGWTVADLCWALDHTPDGMARTWTTGVRSVGGWLLGRLQAWTDSPGVPRQAPSVQIRAAHVRRCAEQWDLQAQRVQQAIRRDTAAELSQRIAAIAGPSYGQVLATAAAREIPNERLRQRLRGAWPALARAAVLRLTQTTCTDRHSPAELTESELRAGVLALLAGDWIPASSE